MDKVKRLELLLNSPKWHRPDFDDALLNVRRHGPLTARDYMVLEKLLEWALANLNVDTLPSHALGDLHHSPEDADR